MATPVFVDTGAYYALAVSGEAVLGHADRYGQRYVVDFELVGPRGRITIRSAWIIRPGETAPRLVTCYIL